MIKLIVTDIDDTLVNSNNEISQKNREILEKCKEQDIKVILASGRPDFGMMKIVEDLKLDSYDNYLLSFNGARIANLKTGEVVYEKFLSPERIKFLIDVALMIVIFLLIKVGKFLRIVIMNTHKLNLV